MHNLGITLTALMLLGLVIFMAPNILALNRGKALRNIAIWLAVFVVLAFLYQNFGPGRGAPMQTQSGVTHEQPSPAIAKPADNQGFTPPRE
jgi:hypothetical protein